MARPVTKTKVRTLTREIRREADRVANTVDAVAHLVSTKPTGFPTIGAFLESPQGNYARGNLQEMLNVIDGTSAQLRELLVEPGGEQ